MPTVSFVASFSVLSRLGLKKSLNHVVNCQRHVRRGRNSSFRSIPSSQFLSNNGFDTDPTYEVLSTPVSDHEKNEYMKKLRNVRPTGSSKEILSREKPPKPYYEMAVFNEDEELAEVVTPLYRMPYEDQLKKKFQMNLKILGQFGNKLKECGVNMGNNNMPCVLDPTIPSPVTEAYRNKDEFSIYHGPDDHPYCVGFFIDNPQKDPPVLCVSPLDLCITRSQHKLMALKSEFFIPRTRLPVCYSFDDGGNWRNIIIRSNLKYELMLIAVLHPQKLTQEELEKVKEQMFEFYSDPRRNVENVVSLFFQACPHTRCSHEQAPFQLIFGEPYIMEEMNGVTYRIGPESFFQTNTQAAGLLYKVIFNAFKVSKSTTVLDICCGVGPVSFTFAPHVKNCIGLDSSVQAIEDAKANAQLNGFTNVDFVAGNCQILLQKIFSEQYAEDLVAVINPARQALGNGVMRLLRQCKHLKKILYVTCKPEAAVKNFVALCEPAGKNADLGPPFYPMRAVPIDLFPHTNHCELVVSFQRL